MGAGGSAGAGGEPSRALALGLLGHPVGHSLSPVIHGAALAASGLDGQYSLFDVPAATGLDAHFEALRAGEVDGLNVTVPWKREAALRCDALLGDARLLGVANTLVPRGGQVVGDNTDVAGLRAALVARWSELAVDARGADAVVVGAGGAARAAVLAALGLGVGRVRVWNRTAENAVALAAALPWPGAVVAEGELGRAMDGAALVLQAGSGGMGLAVGSDEWQRAADAAAAVLARCAPRARVMDLVYAPRRTPWVEAAARVGREAEDGLAMLVHQARLAFEAWTGVAVPAAPLFAAVQAELAARAARAR